jgi:hypothetical protein
MCVTWKAAKYFPFHWQIAFVVVAEEFQFDINEASFSFFCVCEKEKRKKEEKRKIFEWWSIFNFHFKEYSPSFYHHPHTTLNKKKHSF